MNRLRHVLQQSYRAGRKSLSRIDLRGGYVCLSFMEAPTEPHSEPPSDVGR